MTALRVVAFTGAGVSAPSGLGTYRGRHGLWTLRPELADALQLVTVEGLFGVLSVRGSDKAPFLTADVTSSEGKGVAHLGGFGVADAIRPHVLVITIGGEKNPGGLMVLDGQSLAAADVPPVWSPSKLVVTIGDPSGGSAPVQIRELSVFDGVLPADVAVELSKKVLSRWER